MTFDLKEPKVKKCKSIASKSSTILAKEVEFIKILSPSYLQGKKIVRSNEKVTQLAENMLGREMEAHSVPLCHGCSY